MMQDQQGDSKCIWSTFQKEVEKVKDVDAFVNYGLVLIVPLLTVSMWLTR
jgi:phosphatidylinositol glycan class K